jgi:hypothetical protein
MEITNGREIEGNLQSVKVPMANFADGGVLSGVQEGEAARSSIERTCQQLLDDQVIALDFAGVRAISIPFADASIGRLLSGRTAGYYEDHPIVILNASPDVQETIAASLRLHHLYALSLGDGGPQLLGADEVLATTMRQAAALKQFSVQEIASRLELSPQAANNRLRVLMKSGALQRERVKPERGGREFRYRVPSKI